ncbi:hypothetical protein XA68_14160 [Ophiocordyceps unilateralis]|uniref:Autophagy-related protein 16 domain-containing protein n=1 Tax=Ophiocordyceps unilateralis TaxID=268505 RepID=A0A2A9PN54_OPHUN|nr:hypothetical protein XA68_14160 [Ophiocordyceps unilateralis]
MPTSSSSQRTSANTGRKTRPRAVEETAEEIQERLSDEVKNAYTQLNMVTSDRDRYRHLYEQLNNKLSEAHADKDDVKNQVHSLKEEKTALRREVQSLQRENDKLRHMIDVWDQNYTALEQELAVQLRAANSSKSHARLPERPKAREQSQSKTDKGSREQREEKQRLSRRFQDKRGNLCDLQQPSHPLLSSVPRTTAGPGPYTASAGRDAAYAHEDGNYHFYPVSR